MTSFLLLSLKNDVNVPSKSNKQKKLGKNYFLRLMTKIAGSEFISQRHGSGDPDPDPHQNGSATLVLMQQNICGKF